MKNKKKLNNPGAGFRLLTAVLLILLLLFSLGACGKGGADKGNGLDISADGGDDGKSSDKGSGSGQSTDGTSGGGGSSGGGDSAYDESVFPLKENYKPTYPEYAGSITWYEIPKDYIGGVGDWVEPAGGGEGYVNIREKPTTSSAIVSELRPSTEDNRWWRINEMYQENGQAHIGYYNVEADGYTWGPVENRGGDGGRVLGWVALDLVEIHGL